MGNLYNHTGQPELAQAAYERAIELDPQDIEAHAMLGDVLTEAGQSLDAVPHWHAVLRLARNAHHVDTELRRNLVRSTIHCLLDAHVEFPGRFELFPTSDPGELQKHNDGKPLVLELRQVNLGTKRGVDDLCDLFMGPQPRHEGGLSSSPRSRERDFPDFRPAAPIRHAAPAVGRNDPCPCGSGRKYKKCCGH